MSSLKMTFSLTSLILIFALAFVAVPAMAADGGPTPTITEYSGLNDPNTAASATNVAHEQERTDFRLMVTFDALVTGTIAASDFTVSVAEGVGKATETTTTSGIGTITAITTGADANKSYMVEVNLDSTASTSHTAGDYSFGYISFVLNPDVVTGNQAGHSTDQIQNVRSAPLQLTSQIPKNNDWTITASLGTDAPEIADGKFTVPDTGENTFSVLFTFSGGTGAIPEIPADQIQVMKADGTDAGFTQGSPTAAGLVTTVIYTISSGSTAVDAPVSIGVNPLWANAMPAGGLRIPAADPVTPDPPEITTHPTAEIMISDHDAAERTFRIQVAFTAGENDEGDPVNVTPGADFHMTTVKGTDSSDAAVTFTKEDAVEMENSYTAILKYNLLSVPPLTITLARTADANYKDTSDPTDDATGMVGEAGPTPPPANAPAKPDAPTAMINASNDLIIDVSWTAPADNGSAITGYTVTKYDSDGMVVKTFPETGDPAITATMLAVGPVPEADRGMSFTFTVMATNANGTSAESDMSAAVMIPMAAVTNNPPSFPTGSSIAAVVIWKGHAYTTPVLPKATDDEGDQLQPYTITPDLPDGLRLVANDVQDRTITGTATVASAKTTYKFVATDQAGATAELSFDLTVLEPIVPSAPTMVMAMEEGDLGGLPANIARTVNTNKVVVDWVAPVDTTVTSHDPAIPFGSPITGYMVYQSDALGNSMTYPPAGADAIMKDATSYTTPAALALGMYDFEVAAVNSVGTGAKSTPKAPVTVADPPDAPTDLRASKVPTDPNSTTLDWLLPEKDGGLAVAGYVIYQTLDGGPELSIQIAPAITHKVAGLEAGRHVFRIAAFNEDGLGQRSISTAFSVDVPLDPTNVKPTFGDATIANITATQGMAIQGMTLPAATDPDGDDGNIKYSLSPLPRLIGLNFNTSTRFLSGTPSRAQDATIYTYTARDAKGATASLNFTLTVNARDMPVETGDLDATHNDATGVTTINSGMIAANSFATVGSQSLPDLEDFFKIGGTIGLADGDATDDKNSRAVVISEILWGLDLGAPATAQNQWQFIELYNTTGAAINVGNWTLTFTEGNVVPASDIDQMSNRGRTGWNVDSGDTGKSGRVTGTTAVDLASAITPQDIVSMYRNIDYARVEKPDHNADAAKNREEQLKGIPGGNGKGSWKASQRRSTYNRWIYDSKRAKHFKPVDILSASSVAGGPFRINEIGNDTGSANDWIELHNETDSTQSLKNYQLTKVTAQGTDTEIFDFKDQDWKVGPKGYVVISTRHPRDTDLAQGKDISVADDQEENRGASHLFVVKPVDLPDNGEFALILRNAHDKEKSDAHLIDVVATSKGAFKDNNISTDIWPLKATGGPHGNVIDGGDEVFSAGKVYQRSGDNNGRGEKNFAVRGYTGIGYDRAAENSGVNGGTPGYDNGAIKDKILDGTTVVFNATITFSEIMLDLGSGRQNLPQWIELYNSSMTEAVNLNGWKLHVENTADVATALDAVLTLGSMVIAPNQTVLIVTNTGRISDPDHFPSNRVLNLWTNKGHRDALEMKKRTDQVFSTTGLYLKLTDTKNNTVDEFGNLDGDRRTRDELMETWTIPMSEDEDGRRSSLVRRYASDDDPTTHAVVEAVGTEEDAWVLADETNLAFAISPTYYGDPDDFGTPGQRGGGPLPVSLSKFRPERLESGEVLVRWITESELNNAGFNILRSETRNGEFTKVHFVAGQGTTTERNAYEWKDTSAKPNVVYYYQIQDVSLDGEITTLRQSRLKGDISPDGKLTTTWGEIKALQ